MLQINTNQNKTRKLVEIDGHPFTVRKVGAGEELILMQKMREFKKLENKKDLTEQDEIEVLKIANQLLTIFTACYDDGADGSKTKKLVDESSWEDLKAYHDYIFGEENAEVS